MKKKINKVAITPIAITGGAGFVGRHLIKRLASNGYKIDLLIHRHEFSFPHVKTVWGDLISCDGLDKFLKDKEVAVHLAGRFSPPAIEIFKGNVLATFNLMKKCAQHGIKRIIFSSGMALYGESQGKTWEERDKPRPNTVYGLSKLLAEEIIRYWGDNFKLKYLLLRFPNIYGPGSQKGVIFNFLKSIEKEGGVVIYGDGRQRRDFLFIDDAVEAIVKALGYQGPSGIFNIGSGKTFSLLEVVSILEKLLDRKILIDFQKPQTHVVRTLSGKIKKAKLLLDWQPKVSLEEGLRLTIKTMRRKEEK